jgi:deazaflavin-dependent oxidoreductase (nitroreductase family)
MKPNRFPNGLLRGLGATPAGVWFIKHVIAPLDRRLYRLTGGRRVSLGQPVAPTLLLTTIGRKSGQPRTTPVFYLRDGEQVVICNVNPGFERPNPWVLNLRANPTARLQIGPVEAAYQARAATPAEIEQYWPALVALWSAYQPHHDRGGQRSLFILSPLEGVDHQSGGA